MKFYISSIDELIEKIINDDFIKKYVSSIYEDSGAHFPELLTLYYDMIDEAHPDFQEVQDFYFRIQRLPYADEFSIEMAPISELSIERRLLIWEKN